MSSMREARSWLHQILLRRLEQAAGDEYTILLAPKERPGLVTKALDDGSILEVELSWLWDAPRVAWAERIFTVDGEEMRFTLPPSLIRLVVTRTPPRRDDNADESIP